MVTSDSEVIGFVVYDKTQGCQFNIKTDKMALKNKSMTASHVKLEDGSHLFFCLKYLAILIGCKSAVYLYFCGCLHSKCVDLNHKIYIFLSMHCILLHFLILPLEGGGVAQTNTQTKQQKTLSLSSKSRNSPARNSWDSGLFKPNIITKTKRFTLNTFEKQIWQLLCKKKQSKAKP